MNVNGRKGRFGAWAETGQIEAKGSGFGYLCSRREGIGKVEFIGRKVGVSSEETIGLYRGKSEWLFMCIIMHRAASLCINKQKGHDEMKGAGGGVFHEIFTDSQFTVYFVNPGGQTCVESVNIY